MKTLQERFANLNKKGKKIALDTYLKRLGQSINVDYESKDRNTLSSYIMAFKHSPGWGNPKQGYSWKERVDYWDRAETLWLNDSASNLIEIRDKRHWASDYIPAFPRWLEEAISKAESTKKVSTDKYYTLKKLIEDEQVKRDNKKIENDKKVQGILDQLNNSSIQTGRIPSKIKETKMKRVLNEVLQTNKEAFEIGTKLTAGKTANSFFLNKLFGHFPWYAKLFGNKKTLVNNPLAKLATANLAKVLAENFAAGNDKLEYVADAMVQDAMVDLTRDSAIVDKLIQELESIVDLPQKLKTKE